MFERNILTQLNDWAIKKNRKPLILRGARQVGKTTIVNLFAESFDHYIYLDLEKKKNADLFNRGLDVHDLVETIFLESNLKSTDGRILIFIDEIQNSINAISMLRYFFEDFSHLYIIAAGSLLEIYLDNNKISFPVGRVEFLYMYPMTFDEYLRANNDERAQSYLEEVPAAKLAYDNLLKKFHKYCLIGGMPEVLACYIETGDILATHHIMDNLLIAYEDDFRKYAKSSGSIAYLTHAIHNAPLEAGNRIKFAGFGNSDYRSREMGEALKVLEKAMLIKLIYPTTATKLPGMVDKKKSPKLLFLDTGLLNYTANLQPDFFKHADLHGFYRGLIAEHITYQEIIAGNIYTDKKPVFWVREQYQSTAEIDYLLPYDNQLIPVEVKAGKSGRLRSLMLFMDLVSHPYAIRLFSGTLSIEKLVTLSGKHFFLLNMPYYLSGKLQDYVKWFIKEI